MKPGDQYCKTDGRRVLEIATVLALLPDLTGIPHVHFNVAFARLDGAAVQDGPRTLALSRFMTKYPEHMD